MKRYSYLAILLLLGDVMLFYTALAATLIFRYGTKNLQYQLEIHLIPFSVVFVLWVVVFFIGGLYERKFLKAGAELQNRIVQNIIGAAVIAGAMFYLIPFFDITPKTNLFIDLIITTFLIIIWRSWVSKRISSSAKINTIFFGTSTKEEQNLIRHLAINPHFGYEPVSFVAVEDIKPEVLNIPIVRFDHNLPDIVREHHAELIVASSDIKKDESITRMLYQILPLGVSFIDFPSFYEHITGKIPLALITEIWFVENLAQLRNKLRDTLKRFLDIFLALIGGIVILIFFPFIALAIKSGDRGPIFIRQKRTGKNGVSFMLYKFRSMVALSPEGHAEKNGAQWAEVEDKRVTRIGNILRKTHLDELPQVWNILRGELSIAGPRPERPELVKNLEREIPHYAMRHIVKPGVTGWAQINMPQVYAGSVEESLEKLQYDLYYIKNQSVVLDLFIILKTVLITLTRAGR